MADEEQKKSPIDVLVDEIISGKEGTGPVMRKIGALTYQQAPDGSWFLPKDTSGKEIDQGTPPPPTITDPNTKELMIRNEQGVYVRAPGTSAPPVKEPVIKPPDTSSQFVPGMEGPEPNPYWSGAGTSVETDTDDGSKWLVDGLHRRIRQISGPQPGWEPGRGLPPRPPQATPLQARYPEQVEAAQLGLQKDRLAIEKAQRDLQGEYVNALQSRADALKRIAGQLALPSSDPDSLTPVEAEDQMRMINENLQATLKGTTPWQMQTKKKEYEQTERKNKLDLSRNIIGDRLSTGGSIGNSLMDSLLRSRIRSSAGPPTNYDPYAVGMGTAAQYGVGQGNLDLANALIGRSLQAKEGWE